MHVGHAEDQTRFHLLHLKGLLTRSTSASARAPRMLGKHSTCTPLRAPHSGNSTDPSRWIHSESPIGTARLSRTVSSWKRKCRLSWTGKQSHGLREGCEWTG